ncbi:putative periplasmic or secreted lipoprotein [Candidatus Kinetoplastibacterium desouzaii TCC079E]|uniref:Putative periplasmic or secreted lipoprotein n=1 Tax=Candidatus Kinetoplastidibacterium desouzai TCC079E TaxID=1208919 RepID=M1LND1_9PROT|nr:BON domain-containing protein [Candidatus Kinetoplastibacterium desouzaii]AGF47207.1 putative periplasmic or secreted lipoprotein [Candidatus Kinetoplastibacterium desouzaii TCC079E]
MITTKYKRSISVFYRFAVLLTTICCLSSCSLIPIVVGGTAITTISVATDPRNVLSQIDDYTLGLKIRNEINKTLKRHKSKDFSINVNSYNKKVLITGYVNKISDIAMVNKITSSITGNFIIINQLQIRNIPTIYDKSKEKIILSKIKTSFLRDKNIPTNSISVVVDQKKVFLMGIVTKSEGAKAAQITANTKGVDHVIKLFEYIENNK